MNQPVHELKITIIKNILSYGIYVHYEVLEVDYFIDNDMYHTLYVDLLLNKRHKIYYASSRINITRYISYVNLIRSLQFYVC